MPTLAEDYPTARARADRYRHTPHWQDRLTPDAVRFVRAVDAYSRNTVTCLSCGAPYGQPHAPDCEFQTVTS